MRSYQYQEPPPSTWPAPPLAPFHTSHSDQPNPLPTNLHPSHSVPSSPRRLNLATLRPP